MPVALELAFHRATGAQFATAVAAVVTKFGLASGASVLCSSARFGPLGDALALIVVVADPERTHTDTV